MYSLFSFAIIFGPQYERWRQAYTSKWNKAESYAKLCPVSISYLEVGVLSVGFANTSIKIAYIC
jgi:hypothetical protein